MLPPGLFRKRAIVDARTGVSIYVAEGEDDTPKPLRLLPVAAELIRILSLVLLLWAIIWNIWLLGIIATSKGGPISAGLRCVSCPIQKLQEIRGSHGLASDLGIRPDPYLHCNHQVRSLHQWVI